MEYPKNEKYNNQFCLNLWMGSIAEIHKERPTAQQKYR